MFFACISCLVMNLNAQSHGCKSSHSFGILSNVITSGFNRNTSDMLNRNLYVVKKEMSLLQNNVAGDQLMCSWEMRLSAENITSSVSIGNNRAWNCWAEPITEPLLEEGKKKC